MLHSAPGEAKPPHGIEWHSQVYGEYREVGGMSDLRELAVKYGTDKAIGHEYCPAYEQHLAGLRLSVAKVLEIGVLDGASLFMWQDYFPNADIYGIDIAPKPEVVGPRITTLLGSQADAKFLRRIATQCGPFDLIVDDGSHVPAHVICSLKALFPFVSPGGLYVVEDTQTSYWPEWSMGSPQPHMEFLKDLCDGVNWSEFAGGPRTRLDEDVQSIEFQHNLCFLRKMP